MLGVFRNFIILSFVFCALIFSSYMAYADVDGHGKNHSHDDVTIEKLDETIFMIQAGGGNIVVSVDDSGVFMIDNGLSEKSEAVMEAVKSISDLPIKMVVNTHWHYDHTGNNTPLGENNTIIIAHDNVRQRLKDGGTIKAFDKVVEPAPAEALPIITYDKDIVFYQDQVAIQVIALDPAHTDGDSVVYWEKENILHAGDIFFNGFFPFIDSSSGGSLRGMLGAVEKIMTLINDETKIIPGHGPVATKADFENYQKFLKIVADRVATARAQGMSKEDWIAKNLLEDLNEEWGDGFLDLSTFTALIWDAY